MASKKLTFFFENPEIRDSIVPAKKHIPEWYKKAPTGHFPSPTTEMVKTVKNCMPFLDSLTTGYIVETTQDFRVSQMNGNPIFQWNIKTTDVSYINKRDTHHVPTPHGYASEAYVWTLPHVIKSPKGYSLLFTHPLNRTDLPFFSLSGIIDADEAIGSGNYPFFLKEGFEGVIPTGTPILQIIPFKREKWQHKHDEDLQGILRKQHFLSSRVIKDWYKNNLWRKKQYD